MIIVRWLVGLLKRLFAGWEDREWFYYNRTGLDPKMPAYLRWEVRLKDEPKEPQTDAERLMPLRNYAVILTDKLGFTAEDMVFFTQQLDKAQAVHEQYQRELRTRSAGDFYYRMVKNRQLDFFHNF